MGTDKESDMLYENTEKEKRIADYARLFNSRDEELTV